MMGKNVRPYGRNACIVLTGCALTLSAMGCFLAPMPPDGDIEAESVIPVEAGLFGDVVDSLDPVVEEPIRELGDTPEDDVRADDEADEEAVVESIEETADLNDDGVIDDDDVDFFRSAFGSSGDQEAELAADLDGDGVVTLVDFQILLTLAEGRDGQ